MGMLKEAKDVLCQETTRYIAHSNDSITAAGIDLGLEDISSVAVVCPFCRSSMAETDVQLFKTPFLKMSHTEKRM